MTTQSNYSPQNFSMNNARLLFTIIFRLNWIQIHIWPCKQWLVKSHIVCSGTFDQVYLFYLLINTVLRDLNSAQIEQCLWAIWWSQSNFSIRAWMQSIQRLTTSKEEKSHQMPAKIFLIYHNGDKVLDIFVF